MSVLCTSKMDDRQINYYNRYRDNHQRMTSLYNKWNTTASTSSSSSSYYTSNSSSFEVLFSKLLDALIFTSAIAITAYSYLTGKLTEPTPIAPPPTYISPKQIRYSSSFIGTNLLQKQDYDQKRRRTQEWAEQQLLTTHFIKKRSCSTSKVQLLDTTTKREKKRTQSLPVNKLEQEDELFSRMEEKLQSLIQQGQDALSTPVHSSIL